MYIIWLYVYRAEEASEADGKLAKDGDGRPGKLTSIFYILFNF